MVKVVEREYAGREPFDEKTQAKAKDKLRGAIAEREYKRIVDDFEASRDGRGLSELAKMRNSTDGVVTPLLPPSRYGGARAPRRSVMVRGTLLWSPHF